MSIFWRIARSRPLATAACVATGTAAAAAAAANGTADCLSWWQRPKKTVLITGASGYLGQHLLASLAKEGRYELHGTYSSNTAFADDWGDVCKCHKLHLDDAAAVSELMASLKPDVVVHLGAVSSPNVAEKDPQRTHAINSPTALIDGLAPHASLVALSTDQVYDGAHAPYTETDPARPVNVYGASKLAFERALLESPAGGRSIALRMSLLLGPPAPKRSKKMGSFLQDCDRMLSSGTAHSFFDNEYRSVVALDDVLHVLHWAVGGGAAASPGVYNMGGPAAPSRADIARAVAHHRGHSVAGINAIPRPPPTAGQAASPPNIAMDSTRLERAAGLRFRPLEAILPAVFS